MGTPAAVSPIHIDVPSTPAIPVPELNPTTVFGAKALLNPRMMHSPQDWHSPMSSDASKATMKPQICVCAEQTAIRAKLKAIPPRTQETLTI
mmetsp:Transcript_17356/g.31295  ORF Transcript_17356/g.31295 Transcript_17356/m.31295 type:complete len:92 (-) Transcript_17356:8541-8816(-)